MLGEFPHNNRSIELQLMNKFIQDSYSMHASLPEEFNEEPGPLIPQAKRNIGSLLDSTVLYRDECPNPCGWFVKSGNYSVELPSHFQGECFALMKWIILRCCIVWAPYESFTGSYWNEM